MRSGRWVRGTSVAVVLLLILLAACGRPNDNHRSAGHSPRRTSDATTSEVPAPADPVTSPAISLDAADPVIIPTSTSVIVAGGTVGPPRLDQPSATALEWSRRSNAWTRLPDLPADYFGHLGTTVGDTPVLMAAYCPHVASVGDYTESCLGDRILTIGPQDQRWTVTGVPESKDLSRLNTGWAGEFDNHTLALVPESISQVGLVLYDLRSHQFSLRPPPGGRSDGPVASTACVSDGKVYLVARGLGTPGPIVVGPNSPRPTVDLERATIWTSASDGWSNPVEQSTSTVGPNPYQLCSRGYLFFLGETGALQIANESGAVHPSRQDISGLEPLREDRVARRDGTLFGVDASGRLAAATLPGGMSADEPQIVRASQHGDVIDLLTTADTDQDAHLSNSSTSGWTSERPGHAVRISRARSSRMACPRRSSSPPPHPAGLRALEWRPPLST